MYILSKTDLIPWRGRYGPAWRYSTARDFAHLTRPCSIADGLTVDTARYLRLSQQGGESAIRAQLAFPEFVSAFAVQDDQRLRDSLRVLILGRVDDTEILSRTGLTKRVIGLWQAIFFDVDVTKDPEGWLFNQVVGPELDKENLQLAGNLHTALCGGPEVARRLLDGPQTVPSDSPEYAKLFRQQCEIAVYGLLLSPVSSREELRELQKLALESYWQEQQLRLKKEALALRTTREERRQEAADRRLRMAEDKKKVPAKKRSEQQKAKMKKAAPDEQRRLPQREEAAANAQREQAARQARIAASGLLKLPWADARKSEGAPAAAASANPAVTSQTPCQPGSPRSPSKPANCRKRAPRATPEVVARSKGVLSRVASPKFPATKSQDFASRPENVLSP